MVTWPNFKGTVKSTDRNQTQAAIRCILEEYEFIDDVQFGKTKLFIRFLKRYLIYYKFTNYLL